MAPARPYWKGYLKLSPFANYDSLARLDGRASSNTGLTLSTAATKHVPPAIEQVEFLTDKRPVPLWRSTIFDPGLVAQAAVHGCQRVRSYKLGAGSSSANSTEANTPNQGGGK
jgi:hypothetical protein